ncbi:hypothetical protein QTP81_03300 [Alteromonas sp. ASW11-36]|uniref:Sulfotransferase family protein n=1 Tax=Alteromonas arenosi TaxID=3055817 RepID=A0ABT7STV7_9ALTE|nr:hypothetical protein [Alteromonas sp. ASW11-36]MDM7859633.1 hypothetical protein [Alteromonas sp. ASW11-36]
MFVSKPLIYTELHKTAGSHIGKLLAKYVGGEQVGKHNRIPGELRDNFVLGSIRNPWDWYVSLWGYGCDNRGSVYLQSTRGTSWRYTLRQLPREMGLHRISLGRASRQLMHDFNKPVSEWQAVYQDVNDVSGFRKWVKLMFNPDRALDIGEGYGFSSFSQQAGLLSYRFFKLFTSLDQEIYKPTLQTDLSSLVKVWQERGFIDAFVRQENLEEDFLNALEQANIELSDAQKSEIRAARSNKTNTSSRKSANHYYDEETANIILEREKFIVQQFDYDINSILR